MPKKRNPVTKSGKNKPAGRGGKKRVAGRNANSSLEQLLSIFDGIDQPVYVADPETYILLFVNRKVRDRFGQVLGKKCHQALQGLDSPCPFCTNDRIFGDYLGKTYSWDHFNPVAGRWYHCLDRAIRWPDGRMVRYEMAIDIHERKLFEKKVQKLQQKLKKSEQKFRELVEKQSEGVCLVDLEEKILFANPAGEKIFGVKRGGLAGRNLREFLDDESYRTVREQTGLRKSGRSSQYEITIGRPDGEKRRLLVSSTPRHGRNGKVVASFGIFTDITERKRLEEELAVSRKLESIGMLAGGIAHDFNNILTAVLGNISLARKRTAPDQQVVGFLSEAEKACLRAQRLTHKLLIFSAGGEPTRKAFDPKEILKGIVAEELTAPGIKSRLFLTEASPKILCDPFQFEQVIRNLLQNAVQAMPNGGKVEVKMEASELTPKQAPVKKSGSYIRITIEDEGDGIPKNIRDRVFDPFYTTRKGGTGLGLTIVYSIVQKHGGAIEIRPRKPKGTGFSVYLPAAGEKGEIGGARPVPPDETGRVLVVDDQKMIREVAADMISSLGWEVESASDSGSAIELFRRGKKRGRPFSVLLLDLTIPGNHGGLYILEKIREIDPGVKAIVTSGYSNNPVMGDWRKAGFAAALSKPYRIEELQTALREAIAGKNIGAKAKSG